MMLSLRSPLEFNLQIEDALENNRILKIDDGFMMETKSKLYSRWHMCMMYMTEHKEKYENMYKELSKDQMKVLELYTTSYRQLHNRKPNSAVHYFDCFVEFLIHEINQYVEQLPETVKFYRKFLLLMKDKGMCKSYMLYT